MHPQHIMSIPNSKIGIIKGRVRGLVRVSNDDQDPESQRKVLLAFADQEDFRFQEIVVEHGRKRGQARISPEFTKLIRDGENGTYDWLVIDHSDRLGAHDADEYGYWITQLKWANIRVWAVNRGELTKNDQVTTLTNTLDHINSLDWRNNHAERISRGVRSLANDGFLPFSGKYGDGYDRECIHAKTGEVLFRVVTLPGKKKQVIYPDGTEVVLGKGKYPPKDKKEDHYRPVISRDPSQIAWVQEAFRRFVGEKITVYGLARDFQRRGVQHAEGNAWTHQKILNTLRNPLYTGRLVTHRSASARYKKVDARGAGYEEGVRTPLGKPKYREIPKDQWVLVGHREDLRLIDDDVWEEAQRRLDNADKVTRAPSTPDLWLRPFLVCGNCGGPMHGYGSGGQKPSGTLRRPKNKYRCWNYVKHHKNPPSGCGPNFIDHDRVESVLPEAIQNLAMGVQAFHQAIDKPFKAMVGSWWSSSARLKELFGQMKERLAKYSGGRLAVSMLDLMDEDDLIELYRAEAAEQDAKVQADLKAAYADLEGEMHARRGIPAGGPADRLSLARIAALEATITDLEAALVPIDKRIEDVYQEQLELLRQFSATQKAIRKGSNRQKAEALSKVIRRIQVHFKPNSEGYREPGSKGLTPSHIPTKLTFEPIAGEPFDYTFAHNKSASPNG